LLRLSNGYIDRRPLGDRDSSGVLALLGLDGLSMLVTGILDLDTGRLIDVLPARSDTAVTDWRPSPPDGWPASTMS
jgi:hypothetical protein